MRLDVADSKRKRPLAEGFAISGVAGDHSARRADAQDARVVPDGDGISSSAFSSSSS
jgi:hypothetical protein